jgi:hypothetical protein
MSIKSPKRIPIMVHTISVQFRSGSDIFIEGYLFGAGP